MGRRATGQVLERRTKAGETVYGIRFRAYGERRSMTLGSKQEGWSRRLAEQRLAEVIADVRRGKWGEDEQPSDEVPRFYDFAQEWFDSKRISGGSTGTGLAPSTEDNMRWALERHVLPYFANYRLDAIKARDIDAFRDATIGGGLGPGSTNKLIAIIDAILERGVEYEHIAVNPAKGRNRRARTVAKEKSAVVRADHLVAIIDAGARLDKRSRRGGFRALLATLAFGGLRIGEALALTWDDVDLAAGTLSVTKSKTPAGVRTIPLLPVLLDGLRAHRASRANDPPDAYVFRTGRGGKDSAQNVRNRIIARAVPLADKVLAERGLPPLPSGLTPHSFRRSYASILLAIGTPLPTAKKRLGHKSGAFTLDCYSQEIPDDQLAALRMLVGVVDPSQTIRPIGTMGAPLRDALTRAA